MKPSRQPLTKATGAAELVGRDGCSQLRGATRRQHEAVERTALARAIFEERVCARLYAALLGIHQGLLSQLLPHLLTDGRFRGPLVEGFRQQLERLHCDLRSCTHRPQLPAPARAALGEAALSLSGCEGNAAYLAGWSYVLGGSALGARVVSRRLAASLGETEPMEFFRLQSEKGAAHFRVVRVCVERLVVEQAGFELALGGAREAFGAFACAYDAFGGVPGESLQSGGYLREV